VSLKYILDLFYLTLYLGVYVPLYIF